MVRFKMLGRDINSSPTQYRTWVVNDQPDFTGSLYQGLKSGPDPLAEISAFELVDPSVLGNFNLPNPVFWYTTRKVLPSAVYNSQLGIIDGYAYLFGGQGDASIYQASTNNPTDWINTGATLPTPLASSQLAILDYDGYDGYQDGYLYLFGGSNGGPSSTIYSAPISNPLQWTNKGNLLPFGLAHSQIAIIGSYLYLFGGNTSTGPTAHILKASIANPLVWTDTGVTLPAPLYSSQVAIIGGNIYLFGGLTGPNSPSFYIMTASVNNPLVWSYVQYALPYAMWNAQFVAIGDQGYLIGPTTSGSQFTKIFRCNLSNPQLWYDSGKTVPGIVTQSQLGIIYDRIWLFGGCGSSIIFTCDPLLKSLPGAAEQRAYGNVTRTQYDSVSSELDLFGVLGFPNWKTDYGGL